MRECHFLNLLTPLTSPLIFRDSQSDLRCSKTSGFVHQHLAPSVGIDTKNYVVVVSTITFSNLNPYLGVKEIKILKPKLKISLSQILVRKLSWQQRTPTKASVPPPPIPSLPQYPEMIMAAIEALNDSNGSSKSVIAKHIESTYRDLPESHTALLAHHLNKMKDTDELVLVKNNYMKPDPNAVVRPRPKRHHLQLRFQLPLQLFSWSSLSGVRLLSFLRLPQQGLEAMEGLKKPHAYQPFLPPAVNREQPEWHQAMQLS
ncbi:hypothetical protein FF2_000593 [Malus domestica]